MIKLRLKRFGKKREASFRIVAMHSTSRRDGRALEELGFYNPRTKEVKLNEEALSRRLKEGAQPTDTVRRLLENASILEKTAAKAKAIAASVAAHEKAAEAASA
jgi:small subunit ribosomal protein S16